MTAAARADAGFPARRWVLGAAVLSAVLGILAAALTRPRSILADAEEPLIPKRETAWGQLYHARRTETPRAWEAVWEYFPDDAYAMSLAKKGLARHYLETGDFRKALPHLEDLANLGETETNFRAFGLAGKCIVLSLLGRSKEAMDSFALLTPEMTDRLDPPVRRMLLAVVSRHHAEMREKMRGRTREIFDRLKDAGGEDELPLDRGND